GRVGRATVRLAGESHERAVRDPTPLGGKPRGEPHLRLGTLRLLEEAPGDRDPLVRARRAHRPPERPRARRGPQRCQRPLSIGRADAGLVAGKRKGALAAPPSVLASTRATQTAAVVWTVRHPCWTAPSPGRASPARAAAATQREPRADGATAHEARAGSGPRARWFVQRSPQTATSWSCQRTRRFGSWRPPPGSGAIRRAAAGCIIPFHGRRAADRRSVRQRHTQEVTRVLAWIFGAVTAIAVGCVIIPASLFTLFFISQDDVSAASRLLPDRSTRF